MSFVERLSSNIAQSLGNRLDKNDEEIAVLNYGLFFIIHTTTALIATLLAGIVFNILLEIMTISIVASSLKRYSGGVHSSTPNRCTLSGLILSISLAFCTKYVFASFDYNRLLFFVVIILVSSIYIFYNKCPVPSKNKPLKNEKTRKKLRKKSFQLLSFYGILIVIFLMIYNINEIYIIKTIVASVTLGVALQTFSISKPGHIGINIFEKIFDIVNLK